MRRRQALALLAAGGVAASAAVARAQRPSRPVRLGYVSGARPDDPPLTWIRRGLDRIGWVEGRDFTIRARHAAFDMTRLPLLVDELLREGIDILLPAGVATSVVPIAQHAVPVVFAMSGDPVAAGIVNSLARPGGNATGVSQMAYDLIGKRMQFLREIAPDARRTAVLSSPEHAGEQKERGVIHAAAHQLGMELVTHHVRTSAEIAAAIDTAKAAGCDSLTCFADPATLANRAMIGARAAQLRWPSTFGRREFCEAGGLVSYGPNVAEVYARLAYFIQKIAAGTRAADLPIELPSVIETVVNRGTATALALTVPPSLLARADEVIE